MFHTGNMIVNCIKNFIINIIKTKKNYKQLCTKLNVKQNDSIYV